MEEYEGEATPKKISSNISYPPENLQSPFDANYVKPPKPINKRVIKKYIDTLGEINSVIKTKLDIAEHLDITISVLTYKVYDATYDFKNKINAFNAERTELLAVNENKSDLSLILNDLDKKIDRLNKELALKANQYNQQKISMQEQMEQTMAQLDEDVAKMEELLKKLKAEVSVDEKDMFAVQQTIICEDYNEAIKEFQDNLQSYQQLQLKGWRMEQSEVKLSEMLEEQGLKFTPSGRLLTRSGSRITFEEAQAKGYFKQLDINLEKILECFKTTKSQPILSSPKSSIYSEGSSVESGMSSEDVRYLKQCVGTPLAMALAEITTKQPRDPIHYLAHYLFKYRYNQEIDEVQKRDMDELTKERKTCAEQRWKKMVDEEARNAVIDMILRAEEIAYQNDLRRLEEEQRLMAEEEMEDELDEALAEEARDKFE